MHPERDKIISGEETIKNAGIKGLVGLSYKKTNLPLSYIPLFLTFSSENHLRLERHKSKV